MHLSLKHLITDFKANRVVKKKNNIRAMVSARRKSLTRAEIDQLSAQVMTQLESLPEFKAATSILVYYPLRNEVDTRPLLNRWYKEKRILLPVINGSHLDIRTYEGEDKMTIGQYNIMEPVTNLYNGPIDLVVIPGVAFDRKLNRLGRGRGYYDRFLNRRNRFVIGVCYDFQLIPEVPTLRHDHRVTKIITPTEIVVSSAGSAQV